MSVHKVVYRGLSDIRVMSIKDLKDAGVHSEGDLLWDTRGARRPAVFIEDISDRLLEIFRLEGTFTVTEVDEQTLRESGQEPIVVGEPLDDTGYVVRDATSGQQSEKGEGNANADPVPVTPAGAEGSAGGSAGPGANRRSGKGSTGRGSSTGGGGVTGNGSST